MSKFLESGWNTYLPGKYIESNLLDDAMSIYIFDLITQNVDRRPEKPNLLTNGHTLVALDHELAFSFIQDLLRAINKPWHILGTNFSTNHILYSGLKGKSDLVPPHIERMGQLADGTIQYLPEIIPASWSSNNGISIIMEHLTSLFDNLALFEAEIIEVLK